MRSDLVDVTVQLLHETDKAIRVSDGTREAWLPKSQVEYNEVKPGIYEVTAPEWLLLDKGLI